MFAFFLLDRTNRVGYLARDRFGEKPLYWAQTPESLVFGSELKALRPTPNAQRVVSRSALAAFVRGAAVQAPATIYEGVSMVEPGTYLRFDLSKGPSTSAQRMVFWDSVQEAANARSKAFTGSPSDALDALDECLGRSVVSRTVADVPVGAFLSGGIDSSLIVALLQKNIGETRTFTIGSPDPTMNESGEAKLVAQHLGTDHTEFIVTAQEAIDVVTRLPEMYDEPFADSSQIPTFLVSALARKHVTVALSGDAGDELFGGYNRYLAAGANWGRIERLPLGARRVMSRAALSVRPASYDRAGAFVQKLGVARGLKGGFGNRLHKAARAIGCASSDDLYRQLTTHWEPESLLVSPPTESPGLVIPNDFSVAERMMIADTMNYLPSDILTKVDRASMAVALECRVPFLSPDVYRFAWSLPLDQKVRPGMGKVVLRDLLGRYVPPTLTDRPKMGFGIPLDSWLRGPLREWADDLLSPESLRSAGFFDPAVVRARWDEHQSMVRNWQHELWDIVMFQAWYAKWS